MISIDIPLMSQIPSIFLRDFDPPAAANVLGIDQAALLGTFTARQVDQMQLALGTESHQW